MMAKHPRPLALRREGDEFLVIEWDDGKLCRYRWADLRRNCPCAVCLEERAKPPDPFRILKPSELQPLRPVRVDPVGYYAYRIVWSDGHDAGIYTLEYLRKLCEEQASAPAQ